MPRPGMLPPSLKGRVLAFQLAPRSEERRTAPLVGSQLLVYVPTAAYTLSGSAESEARLTTPDQPQWSQSTQSSSGVHCLPAWSQR